MCSDADDVDNADHAPASLSLLKVQREPQELST